MPIRAHVWETALTPPAPTAHMTPMYVCVMSNMNKLANELAADAYAAIEEDPSRPLFLRHCCQNRSDVEDLKPATYLDFMATGPRVDGWRGFMSDFWVAWAQIGDVRPSRIVLEFEKHYTWYAIPGDNPARAAAVQAVRNAGNARRYPAEFNAFTQTQLASHNNHTSSTAGAIALHDTIAKQRMNKALTEIVLGTYSRVFQTPPPPSSNYNDARLRVGHTSAGGYAFPAKIVCMGSDSSPALYFDPNGGRYSSVVGSTAKQFAAMKGEIERIRAIRGPIVPWVGPPGYRGDGFDPQTSPSAWVGWRKFIHTLALHGVDEVLYFIGNYAHEAGERAFADETFATAVVSKPNARHRWNKPSIDTATLLTGTAGWTEQAFAYSAGDWQ